jgi:hypothetical protein
MKSKKVKFHKMKAGAQRQSQIEQGFFDGRFVQRAEPSKKKYTRKAKHPKRGEE